MRNVEDVDRMLDAEDLAVRHDEDRPRESSTAAVPVALYRPCRLCGAREWTLRGLCLGCRQLEGSVWQQGW